MTTLLITCIVIAILAVSFWPLTAYIVSRETVSQWLYRCAQKTPYWDLEGYMNRWWLFNPINTTYENVGTVVIHDETITEIREVKTPKYRWCPVSIRMHHILRADNARDPHNHPGSFRTIVVRGWYEEHRDDGVFWRTAGDTAVLRHDEFHHVGQVSPGGVWTIFIMWNWKTSWGFRVADGSVVDHRDYHNGGKP